MLRKFLLSIVALLSTTLPTTLADCECGYILPSSNTSTNTTTAPRLYTHLLETDFLHLTSFTPASSSTKAPLNGSDWLPQEYTVSPTLARGPYGKNASLDNVRLNPLKHGEWSGAGAEGGDAGLQIFVRGLKEGEGEGALVGMGELASRREDMLFGSFRVGMKMSAVPGTCAAFFWYYNDTSEIDLEYLSRQRQPPSPPFPPLNLVLQSPTSLSHHYSALNTSTFAPHPLPFDPTSAVHEYRFDWSPTTVSFYADGILLDTMTDREAVPGVVGEGGEGAGHVVLSHWSNGDGGWSGGPPREGEGGNGGDAVVVVKWVRAYFNVSDEGERGVWERGCRDRKGEGEGDGRCVIPDTVTRGGGTGDTGGAGGAGPFFFSEHGGGEEGGGGKKNDAVSGRGGAVVGMKLAVTIAVMGLAFSLTFFFS